MSEWEQEQMREAKRLTQQAATRPGDTCQGVVDLTLAVNILIGLVEGHRHGYWVPNDIATATETTTGPMQAMENR